MRILITRLGAMGDVLHALPAVAALRRALPAAHIGWVIEQRWKALLAAEGTALAGPRSTGRPLIDCLHLVDTVAWRSSPAARETLAAARAAIRELRHGHYDLALDFQGALKSAAIAAISGAPRRLGFARTREAPAGLFYTRRIPPKGVHVIEQNLSLAAAALSAMPPASPPDNLEWPLPRDPAADRHCEAELSRRGIGAFAMLNPGAGWGAKQWPSQRYAEVARALGRLGLQALVNFGPGEEALAESVIEHSGGAAAALPCTLPQLIALTRRAQLFVGGDTGPMHLAAALRVPVVALFGPTDPARNGPCGAPSVVFRSPRSATSYSHHSRADAGLLAISSAEVIAAAQRLLAVAGGLHA